MSLLLALAFCETASNKGKSEEDGRSTSPWQFNKSLRTKNKTIKLSPKIGYFKKVLYYNGVNDCMKIKELKNEL